MVIKKHPNRNEYTLVDNSIWVRNFCKQNVPYIDINKMITSETCNDFLINESSNYRSNYSAIDGEDINFSNIIIVSDGYQFLEKQHLLANFSYQEVAILAVNGALASWNLLSGKRQDGLTRAINFYIVNNPFKECLNYLPVNHRYYPRCIASTRTYSGFLEKYLGIKHVYHPVTNKYYSGIMSNIRADYKIDDYRNPICAAIGLAYRFGAKNLLLFCCDDSFEEKRAGTVQLENKLWCYPQQVLSNKVIDANLGWLKKHSVKIYDHSNGLKYENAEYISVDNIMNFKDA